MSQVVDLLFAMPPIVCWVSVLVFVWYALLYVLSSFAIILTRKREMVVLLLLSIEYLVTVTFLWLFLTVPLVGLHFVIVVVPDHFRLVFVAQEYLNSIQFSIKAPLKIAIFT